MKSRYILRILSVEGEPSISTATLNHYGRKTMLCVWRDQKDVIYYELVRWGKTINTERNRQKIVNLNQALLENRPEYQQRQHKFILLYYTQQNRSKKRLSRFAEKFFRIRLIRRI